MLIPAGDLPINCISSFKRLSLNLKPEKKDPIAFVAPAKPDLNADPICVNLPLNVTRHDGCKLFADPLPKSVPEILEATLVILPATTLDVKTSFKFAVERLSNLFLTLNAFE